MSAQGNLFDAKPAKKRADLLRKHSKAAMFRHKVQATIEAFMPATEPEESGMETKDDMVHIINSIELRGPDPGF